MALGNICTPLWFAESGIVRSFACLRSSTENCIHANISVAVLMYLRNMLLEYDDAMLVPECRCGGGKMSVRCAKLPNKHQCNDSGTTSKSKLL
ncbi:hypothetical protein AAHA92_21115 [Salvia divinorum]|uniref:Uncharacterized protein n=1 Tax=Salvia divinorum TaxID=28513 RepID=A0ABD1GM79_SALDI